MVRPDSVAAKKKLVSSAHTGDHDTVRKLLADGVHPDVIHDGLTSLYLAAGRGDIGMMETLVSHGANLNLKVASFASPRSALTALNEAVRAGETEAVTWLLNRGADPRIRNDEKQTAAHLLLAFADRIEQKAGAKYLLDTLGKMLDRGIAVNQIDKERRTLLRLAVARLNDPIPVIHMLLDRGANPMIADKDGLTPVHWLAGTNRVSALSALVDRGIDVNTQDESGKTALHCFATGLILIREMGDMLIKAGADLEAQDCDGVTPLAAYLASVKPDGNHEKLVYLLDAGASLDSADFTGSTPRDIIASRGLSQVEALLAARQARNAMQGAIKRRNQVLPQTV